MTDLAVQPTPEPTRKTTASIIGGSGAMALSVIMGWALRTYLHAEIPGEVQVAVATIITVVAAYMTKERAVGT